MNDGNTGYNSIQDMKVGLSLSVLMSSEYYTPILVTDPEGWEVVKGLQLPWQQVILTDFDAYNIPPQVWNLSKFVALDLVDGPLVHLDHDLFLHKPLPEFEGALFQNKEETRDFGGYHPCAEALQNDPIFKPLVPWLMTTTEWAYNCGVIGFKSDTMKRQWLGPVMELLRSPRFAKGVKNHSDKYWPTTIEQITIYQAAKWYGWPVKVIAENHNELDRVAHAIGYTHLLSASKRIPEVAQTMTDFYKKRYPEHSTLIFN
jgi:hypothetical protein